MTAGIPGPGFETLLYTDCRVGQGLSGAAGLQFQARSSSDAWEAAPVVQRSLLYEAPSSWMLARRPVEDYPSSFAHVCDGSWATGKGQYLGREASGSREGNQVTHAVVTRDPESYGLVRPAQLFGADWWIPEPVEGTVCPPVGFPRALEPGLGDFDLERLRDFVVDQPGGGDFLAALHTALLGAVDPGGPRVLFVAQDTGTVLRWLAAGTVLLPQRVALGVSFKAFTTDPVRCGHLVVAVHPEWGADATPPADQGFSLFDLRTGECPPAEVERTSWEWVEAFLSEDPYDVRDAVEVAGASGLPRDAAAGLGRAVQWGVAPCAAVETQVVEWLCRADPALTRAYGTEVFDAVTSGPPDRVSPDRVSPDGGVRTLRLLDEAACAGRI
ncbi:MAG: hypothetical protein QG608_646, partial [Actinomycetota bacterium]|nr:hypothetical protein [Actinomycetota bacterium]